MQARIKTRVLGVARDDFAGTTLVYNERLLVQRAVVARSGLLPISAAKLETPCG